MPQFTQDRKSIAIGQTEIQDQCRVTIGFQCAGGIGDIGEKIDPVPGRLHSLRQKVGQFFAVLDDQDFSWARTLPCPFCCRDLQGASGYWCLSGRAEARL